MQHIALEFLGSLIFFISILMVKPPIVWPWNGAAVGLALAISLIVSSGHLNPAVSTMLYLKNGFPLQELVYRVAAQAAAVGVAIALKK